MPCALFKAVEGHKAENWSRPPSAEMSTSPERALTRDENEPFPLINIFFTQHFFQSRVGRMETKQLKKRGENTIKKKNKNDN